MLRDPRPAGPPAGRMPPAESSLPRDVLDMLEIDASDDVPRWLAARLRDLCAGAQVRLLRVQPANASRVKDGIPEDFWITEDGGEGLTQPLQGDPGLLEALRLGFSTLLDAESGARSLFVLHAAGEVRYAIDIRSGEPAFSPRSLEIGDLAQAYFQRLAALETDPLTRLRTRRVFQKHLDEGIRRWARSPRGHFLAVLDIDRFKRINDDFGHLYGDEILVRFSQLMRRTFRATDLLYRFGGEEFVVIYSTDPAQAGDAPLERFRAAVEGYAFPGVGRVTVSSGFARIVDVSTPSAILVERADEAMYHAKTHGRNRVSSWEALVAAGELKDKLAAAHDVTLF